MFQETKREFNHNLRVRLADNVWRLERKIGFLWLPIKDDRGNYSYTGISDAVIALSRIVERYRRKRR